MWLRRPNFKDEVQHIWETGAGRHHQDVNQQIKHVRECLAKWNKKEFGHIKTRMHILREDLDNVTRSDGNPHCYDEIQRIHTSMMELEQRQEIMWRQRSRQDWLQEGDRNTRFFHYYASTRRRNNRITTLKRQDGGVAETEEDIMEVVHNYFTTLFSSSRPPDNDQISSMVHQKVTNDMNYTLTAPFTEEEVSRA